MDKQSWEGHPGHACYLCPTLWDGSTLKRPTALLSTPQPYLSPFNTLRKLGQLKKIIKMKELAYVYGPTVEE